MAKNIHPQAQEVTFQFSQGRSIKIPACYKKSTFLTETDIFLHSAWRADEKVVHAGSANVTKFTNQFGGASFASFSGTVSMDEIIEDEPSEEKPKKAAAPKVAKTAATKSTEEKPKKPAAPKKKADKEETN